jgi:hypothetical protein
LGECRSQRGVDGVGYVVAGDSDIDPDDVRGAKACRACSRGSALMAPPGLQGRIGPV